MISLLVVLEATLGGTRRHVVDLLCGLDQREFVLTLVYSCERADASFFSVLPELKRRGINLNEVALCRELSPWRDAAACAQLVNIIRRVRPDVIHLHGAKAGAIGRAAALVSRSCAIVYTPHGGSFHKFNGLKGRIFLGLERLFAALCDAHFIGVSEDSCRQIRERLGIREERVHLVYNGVAAVSVEHASEARCDGKFIALYPAVLFEAKGHLPFIEGLYHSPTPLDPRVEIWLAGDGPLGEQIRDRVRQYGLENSIKLLGFVENMAELYHRCDMVLLPSKDEAFGYVALEAMQYGRLILASPVGGLRELIRQDVNGRFFHESDWKDLARCLNAYIDDPTLLQRVGEAGRHYVSDRFSLEQMIFRTSYIYRQALSG